MNVSAMILLAVLAAFAAPPARAQSATPAIQDKAAACFVCHGTNGNSENPPFTSMTLDSRTH